MSVKVLIPTVLRRYTEGQGEVQVEAASVSQVIEQLIARNDQLQTMFFDTKGDFRFNTANLFVNEEDMRFLQKLDTPLKDGDEVSIIAAAAGGRASTEKAIRVTVVLPTPLQKLFDFQTEVSSEGNTRGEAFEHLAIQNPEFKRMMFYKGNGQLTPVANVYVNEEDVRSLQKLDTPLKDGDIILIVSAIHGG